MNLGFPNLKQIFFPQKPRNSRTKSVNRNVSDTKHEHLILSESQSNAFQSPIGKSDFCLHKEISLIQKRLDSKEIELKNQKTLELSTIEQEFKTYTQYLEEISHCIRQKDAILGKSIQRGVVSCEKLFQRSLYKFQSEARSMVSEAKPGKVDFSSQTITEVSREVPIKSCTTPELESFKQLGSALKRIKVSRVTGKLFDVYDSLSKMYTEIPEPTSSPEPQDLDLSNPNSIINLHLNVIKKNINNFRESGKSHEKTKKFSDKYCQDDFPPNGTPQVKALELILNNKEFEMKKIKGRLEKETELRKHFEENIAKLKNYYLEFEKKHNEVEILLVQAKNKNNNSENIILALEKKIKWDGEKLDGKTKKLRAAKEKIKEMKNIIMKKQKDLSKSQDDLYNIKISWKIAEEKLMDLQRAWEKRVGSQYQHKEITKESIIAKFMIGKIEFNDENEEKILNEEVSDVSVNEDPDADDIEALTKSRNQLLYVENLKIIASAKRLEGLTPRSFEVEGNFAQLYLSKMNSESEEIEENTEGEIIEKIEKFGKIDKKKKIRGHQDLKMEKNESEESEESDEEVQGSCGLKKTIKRGMKKNKGKAGKVFVKKEGALADKEKIVHEENIFRDGEGKKMKNEGVQSSGLKLNDRYQENQGASIKTPSDTMKKAVANTLEKGFASTFSSTTHSKTGQNWPPSNKTSISLQETYKEPLELYQKELDLLLKQEKDLLSLQNQKQTIFTQSFQPKQAETYTQLAEHTSDLEKIRKKIQNLVNSKGIQCCFGENQSFSSIIRTNCDKSLPDDMFSPSKPRFSSADSKKNLFESMKSNADARNLLKTVFKDEETFDMLPEHTKIEILKSLQGHTSIKCQEMCPHLLRVMRFKWKVRGTPYPIRTILLKS